MAVGIEFLHFSSIALLPKAIGSKTVMHGDRLTDEPGIVDVIFLTVGQFHDLIFLPSEIQVGMPREALHYDRDCIDGYLDSLVLGLTDIGHHRGIARQRRNAHGQQQILGIGGVEINGTTNASLQETEIDTEVPLCGLLPTEFFCWAWHWNHWYSKAHW